MDSCLRRNDYQKVFLQSLFYGNDNSDILSFFQKFLEFNLQADTRALEAEINNLVYKLYDLTEKEIKL